MHYHIRDVLSFIRTYDNTGLFSAKSNTHLRKHIRACLEKERFYFVYKDKELIGIIEWYRIKNCKYLLDTVRAGKHLNCNPSGKIIFIQNAVFKNGYLTVPILKKFIRQHKNINQVIWFKYKTKKFTSIRV